MIIKFDSLFIITIYSHFFKITNPTPRIIGVLFKFCSNYVIMGYEKEKGRRPVYKPLKVFAARIKDNSEFRFHIGQLPEFYNLLKKEVITPELYEVKYESLYNPASSNYNLRPGWELRDYQKEVQEFIITETENDNRSRLVCLPTGTGKSQPIDSLIKIPNGWKTMGNIKILDPIITKDGSTAFVTGIYPQGLINIYKITFYDGRTAECSIDHLWKVYCKDWCASDSKVLSLRQIINLNSFIKRKRIYIDLIDSEKSNNIELPLDPYILGLFLGDGGMNNSSITITTPDSYILDEIRSKLPECLSIKHSNKYSYRISKTIASKDNNKYLDVFRKLGLYGKIHYQKFIPEIYFHASSEQRLSLLQGLLDTDGTIGKEGSVSFCSSSKDLAEGVQYLVRSLGGMASISNRYTFYTYKGEKKSGRLAYQVNIRYKKQSELFRLPKKKIRTNDYNQYSKSLKLRIEKIEHIGQKEAQCISISNKDKLYVTNDFVVTHNTITTVATVTNYKTRTLVIILPTYIEKWAKDISEITDVDLKKIMLIQGANQLKGLIDLAIDEQLDSDFILISLRTLQSFYNAYEQGLQEIENQGYGCHPEDLCKVLKIGTIIYDEVHQHLHAVFKSLLFTHVPRIIALSATVLSEDPVIKRIQHLMFPKEIRFDKVKMDKYIKVYSLGYQFTSLSDSRIRTTEYGSNTYSHTAFEKSIMKNNKTLLSYLDLIDYIIKLAYIEGYIEGDKLAIFASTIDMCTIITNHVKQKFPQYDTRRYVEKDPYENVIDAQIRVTTILSAGTAIDIPNLRTVIMTTNILSPVANIQSLGRLRKLKDRDVKFYYTYCDQISKQVESHYKRKELFEERVASIKEFTYPYSVK